MRHLIFFPRYCTASCQTLIYTIDIYIFLTYVGLYRVVMELGCILWGLRALVSAWYTERRVESRFFSIPGGKIPEMRPIYVKN